MKIYKSDILFYREQVEKLDNWILQLISQRMVVAKLILDIKAKHNETSFDNQREVDLLNKNMDSGKKLNLKEDVIKEYTSFILKSSKDDCF